MSSTTIVNKALYRLGTERINALTDSNKRAQLMNDIYDSVREELLDSSPWTFALKRDQISPISTTPDFEYSYQYQMPSDCLRIVYEYNGYEYKVEGDYILSDESTLEIVYIENITDTSKFSPKFTKALALTLAVDACYSLTQNNNLKQILITELKEVLADARCFDSQATRQDTYEVDVFLESRY